MDCCLSSQERRRPIVVSNSGPPQNKPDGRVSFQCALNFRLNAMPHFKKVSVCIDRLMYYRAQ